MAVTSKSIPKGTGKAATKIVKPPRPASVTKDPSNKVRRDVNPARAGASGYKTR